MFDRGPKSSPCWCWHPLFCWAKTGEAESEHEANMSGAGSTYLPADSCFGATRRLYHSHLRVSSALPLAFLLPLIPLLFVAIAASPGERWFSTCQQLLPLLSLLIQDVSFRKHELIPSVWLLFAFIQHQWGCSHLLPLLRRLKLRGKNIRTNCTSFFCFPYFCLMQQLKSLLISQTYGMLLKSWLCCWKLVEEFPREQI